MSGDSSGRRPEGRGRGRDPHRDRTRSRSRSRSPLSPGSRRGAAPERREAPERPGLEDTEPSDSGDEMIDPASLEEETDPSLCRQIRHQYRALINSVQRKAGARGGNLAQALRGPAGSCSPGPDPRRPAAPGFGVFEALAHLSCGSQCTTLAGARESPGAWGGPPESPSAGNRPSPPGGGTARGRARSGSGGEEALGAGAHFLTSSDSPPAVARPR